MNEEKLSRRERERLARRNDILNAARNVFAVKGYDRATLDEIAAEADFAKGTIYGYFDNKLDLFLSLIREEFAEFNLLLSESIENSSDFDSGLRAIIVAELKYLAESERFYSSISSFRGKSEHLLEIHKMVKGEMKSIVKTVSKLFKRGMDEGLIKQNIPEVYSFMMISQVHSFYIFASREESIVKIEDGPDLVFDLIMNGIKAGK